MTNLCKNTKKNSIQLNMKTCLSQCKTLGPLPINDMQTNDMQGKRGFSYVKFEPGKCGLLIDCWPKQSLILLLSLMNKTISGFENLLTKIVFFSIQVETTINKEF